MESTGGTAHITRTGRVSEAQDAPAANCPVDDYDFFSPEVLINPHPHYKRLRDKGEVVFLSRYGVYIFPRYSSVKYALENWKLFSSARGVTLNDEMNQHLSGQLLASDPPEHDQMRKVFMQQLNPRSLRDIHEEVAAEADRHVADVCAKGEFDAATELAEHLPLTIVANKVGLPPAGRDAMISWAPAIFNLVGPMEKELTREAIPTLQEVAEFMRVNGTREKIEPGSWIAKLYDAVDNGSLTLDQCRAMSLDYVGPALDTTISATAAAIYRFAQSPDQWDIVRQQPNVIPNAINEVVRLESPIQIFTRYVTQDVEIGNVVIPAGSRVILSYGSANRDERKWDDPERFDVLRKVSDHVGFGGGEHTCAGANLARLEIIELLTALAKRVERFELIAEAEKNVNNSSQTWRKVPVRVHLLK